MDWPALLQALAAIGGLTGLAALINAYTQRRKMQANSILLADQINDRILSRAQTLIDEQGEFYNDRTARLERTVSRLEVLNAEALSEIAGLKKKLEIVKEQNREMVFIVETILIGVNTLTTQLINAGINPEWQMPSSLKKWIGDHF